ncbi:MAG: hypothetical protein GC205_13565 [Bacteroidetes bacterium]|nr:hypothetical protein [Bacteroidota bacterium]
MKNYLFYVLTGCCAAWLLSGCGVQFAPMTLKALPGEQANTNAFAAFSSRSVYSNTTGDEVWGPEACGDLNIGANGAYEGNAIRISWDQTAACDWVGMGIGWDGWQPKDLSGIMDKASLRFQMRASEGESRIPIMIFLLEDYATAMSAAPLRAGYMERYPLDTTWREVILPLSDFPASKDGLDLTNIKQLVVELQGSGDVMLDNMEIIPNPDQPATAARLTKPSITAPASLPVVLFEGSLPNSWGLERNDCRDFSLKSGALILDWWDQCPYSNMGFSWNRWLGVDLSAMLSGAALVVEGNLEPGQGALMLGFEDYGGRSAMLNLRDYPVGADGLFRIPLADFSMDQKGVQSGNLKHFVLDVRGKGKATIRSIRLEKLP